MALPIHDGTDALIRAVGCLTLANIRGSNQTTGLGVRVAPLL
ncbi:MAG TPA: hypothetical protein VFD73_15780 [Gemmatimonadales bacterium]|nr:hypothetical protein [Gemmatimonadales bacterium]